MITKFFGTVTDGSLELDNAEAFNNNLLTLKGEVEIIIRPRKKSRTIKQNDYYWGVVIRMIADETGHSSEEIHELMKSMFLKDILIIKNEVYFTNKSTTLLNTKQFSKDYVDRIKLWALDKLNINIPDPDEIYE